MNDLRSLPDRVLRLYLGSLGVWGAGLVGLFVAGHTPLALTLCYPLALWLGGLTTWWGLGALRKLRAGELAYPEVDAAVVSIGRILAGGSAIPAIVFLAEDPLQARSWGTCLSIAIVSGIAWAGVHGLVRLSNRYSNGLALAAAWAALPVNATGALSVGFWFGWFDVVQGAVGGVSGM